eukprot:s75_g29.t2
MKRAMAFAKSLPLCGDVFTYCVAIPLGAGWGARSTGTRPMRRGATGTPMLASHQFGRTEPYRAEWNQTCETIWPYVLNTLENRLDAKILHVGCGNSRLGRMLHDDGYINVLNVDYSRVVIKMMQQSQPELQFLCADCAESGALGEADHFDFCVDKGAIDSLFESNCDSMWQQGCAMIQEIHRVLKPGGKYLVISNGGIGRDVLKATFGHMQSEEIEGYACDLYYKLITIIVCTK